MRPRRHQLFVSSVYYGSEAFQRARAQEIQIATVREHNFIDSLKAINLNDRVTYVSRDHFSISHDEMLFRFFDRDANLLQGVRGKPSEFRTRIDEEFFN